MSKYKIDKDTCPYKECNDLSIKDPFVMEPQNQSPDRISVSKMEIMDGSIIDTIVKKKLAKQLSKLVSKTMLVLTEEDDEDEGENLKEALNEAAKFQNMLATKYRRYLEREYELEQRAKLGAIVEELKSKRLVRESSESNTSNKGR